MKTRTQPHFMVLIVINYGKNFIFVCIYNLLYMEINYSKFYSALNLALTSDKRKHKIK